MRLLTLLIIGYLLTWLVIPFILLAKKRPAAAVAWTWAVILFPYIGALCYWGFGAERIHRRRLRRRAKFEVSSRRARDRSRSKPFSVADERAQDLLRLLTRLNRVPPALATEVELLYGAPAFFESLHHAIESAQHHVHIQFYIWRDDRYGRAMLEALVRAAERGVEVRLLIDEIGSVGLRSKVFAPLLRAGGRFSWALTIDPLRNRFFWHLRNHRKLQIIDGNIAFVGGMNVGREYFGEDPSIGPWRDAQVKVVGPVVARLQEVFADDWFFATEEKIEDDRYYTAAEEESGADSCTVQVITGGPDCGDEPIQKSFVALLNHASKRVWVTAGYFVPNQLLLTAAEMAAARGVDVRFIVAGRTDYAWMVHASRSYYEQMLEGGVRLWEYHAGFMHAKMMLVDEQWAMVGSANWDVRSMRLNFELNALVDSTALAQRLESVFEEEFKRAQEVRYETFAERPFSQRLREAAIRPISPLL